METFSYDALQCFCALVETGSFGKAAEKTGRTQPALSQRIKSIEERLGGELFDRRRKCLTPLGKNFYELAKEFTLMQKKFNMLFQEATQGFSSELKIGTSDTFAFHLLPKVIREFLRQFPQIQLSVITRSSDEIETMVYKGEINIGVVTQPVGHNNLKEVKICEDPIYLVTSKKHPITKKKTSDIIYDLHDESIVMIDSKTRTGRIISKYLKTIKIEPKCVIDGGSFQVIMKYVAEGFGISFVPRMVAMDWQEKVEIIKIKKTPTIPYVCIYPRFLSMSKTEKTFLNLLKKHTSTIRI